jgi:hypothetical protein
VPQVTARRVCVVCGSQDAPVVVVWPTPSLQVMLRDDAWWNRKVVSVPACDAHCRPNLWPAAVAKKLDGRVTRPEWLARRNA